MAPGWWLCDNELGSRFEWDLRRAAGHEVGVIPGPLVC
jgi:hypothetical protein